MRENACRRRYPGRGRTRSWFSRAPLSSFVSALLSLLVPACGSPEDQPGRPPAPDVGDYDAGHGGESGPYGYGDSSTSHDAPVDTKPSCGDDLKRCPETFTYPFGGESSVELRGDYRPGAWTAGDAMTHVGANWTVSVPVPYAKPVQYKFFVDGKTWVLDPRNPSTITDASGIKNSLQSAITCSDYTCAEPPLPPTGVYDWRDATIYFVFVDRFFDGDPTNDCATPSGVLRPGAYQGGDWAGVKKKIDSGYFTDLGVNTLWITVPLDNADDVAGAGVGGDTHLYSSYHGYWPRDPNKRESCFGSAADLKALVDAAHTAKIKVLFDYAMVHVHKESPVFAAHPDWFWPSTAPGGGSCICGSSACPWDTTAQKCWFTDYLPHWNYTVGAARDFSVTAAVQLVKDTGVDGFRLDAIKHVDGSWLTQLRSTIATEVLAKETPPQRFYMVGETYDFGNRDFIKSFVDPKTKLDGQFDFPLRLHLVKALLMRQEGMDALASFMDSNDDFYGVDAVMSTFVGNHDLPRSIHLADDTPLWADPYTDGKDKAWSSPPIAAPSSRSAYERLANALAVIFTNKGAPLLYYGDEIGLPGAGDPDNRRMMQFDALDANQTWMRDRIKALLAARAAHPAMRHGKRSTLSADADLWVFQTTTSYPSADTVFVAVNRGDSDKSASGLPASWSELVTGASGGGSTTVPARQTRIFVAK